MYYNKFITQTINSFEMRRDKRRWVRRDDAHIILSLQEAHHYVLISKDRTIHYPVRKTHTHNAQAGSTPSLYTYIHVHPIYTRKLK